MMLSQLFSFIPKTLYTMASIEYNIQTLLDPAISSCNKRRLIINMVLGLWFDEHLDTQIAIIV